ncbi:NADH-quinone oxidoreductase subunit NuoE [Kiloniella sp.]|uniref:NADH-quinone oxidoreductase subunit NuoE n=1 Tax=Kiloniella sp. TaxID=1938587 RepID=UPI003B01D329
MDLREQIEIVTKRYPNNRSAIMPALFIAQKQYGYLGGDVLQQVADILDVPEIWVFELATFYTMFHTESIGEYHIQVCTNVSCLLRRAENLVGYLENRLKIKAGETTNDGRFSLSSVECLGACDKAPALMVNQDYFENQDEEKLGQLLDQLSSREIGLSGDN